MQLLDLDSIFDDDRVTVPRPPDVKPDDLPHEWRAMYRERTAIHEVSGGLPRELAEHYGLLDTLELTKTLEQYPAY